jgi:hypothetical protein
MIRAVGSVPMSPSPTAYAHRPLFEPISSLLSGFPDGLPDAAALTACLRVHAPGAVSGERVSRHPLQSPADFDQGCVCDRRVLGD